MGVPLAVDYCQLDYGKWQERYSDVLAKYCKLVTHKQRLLQALISEGWELIEIHDDNHDWWCDEHWLIKSQRENFGLEVMIFFLVDPQWDLPRKKGQGIWAIAATDRFLSNSMEASSRIATLSISKRKFDQKLENFINLLNQHRFNIPQNSK